MRTPLDPIRKAVWYVESHLNEALTLEEIAASCDISTFYLTRAFAAGTGITLMRYVRNRRLTNAAKQLVVSKTDILPIALEAGYGSHEAFTRAFKDLFGLTPEELRKAGTTRTLTLTEPLSMHREETDPYVEPRIETQPAIILAGIRQRHDCRSPVGIPAQWQRFLPHLGTIRHQIGPTAFGACYGFDETDGCFNYLCSVQVEHDGNLPEGFESLHLPETKVAVFRHAEHVAAIRNTMAAIWNQWLPRSGYRPAASATLECYGPEFDGRTGLGGLEIRIPLEG